MLVGDSELLSRTVNASVLLLYHSSCRNINIVVHHIHAEARGDRTEEAQGPRSFHISFSSGVVVAVAIIVLVIVVFFVGAAAVVLTKQYVYN